MKKFFVLAMLAPLVLAAQDPVAGKHQPPSRPLGVTPEQEKKPAEAPLPKIDLPEFVITGSASINPPDVQKKEYDEGGVYQRTPAENATGVRDRQTLELGDRFRQTMLLTGQGLNGALTASLGTFFTPSLWASAGFSDERYDLSASAEYWRTKGFTRYADGSRGSLAINGSIVTRSDSPLLDGARVGGNAALELRSYKFYGSQSPGASREQSSTGFHLMAKSGIESPLALQAGVAFQSLRVADTTSATTENHAVVECGGELPVFDVPVDIHLQGDFATVTALVPATTSLIRLEIGIAPRSLGDFFFQASGHGYLVHGMNEQQSSYFYPHLLVGFRGLAAHVLTLSYDPSVSFSSLRLGIERSPYLSAQAIIRHPVTRFSASIGMESEWIDWLQTKLRVSYQSGTDIPLYADSTGKGMWSLIYGGTTTVTTVRADAVANMTPNDYFAVAATIRKAGNSMLVGDRLPYVAGFDASVLYRHSFPWGVILIPSLSFVGPRRSNVVASPEADACFLAELRAEYLGMPEVTVFLNVENFFDQNYEVWKGYRAEPFRMSLGVSYRW